MRLLEAYNNILIELNKVQAPSLLLDDFIYLWNKGVQEYIIERYNLFETKQQLTDDLRVLLKQTEIDMTNVPPSPGIYGQNYRCVLPIDYLHILNCSCEFTGKNKCGKYTTYYPANKINTNEWAQVKRNYYLKPSVENPYFYIMNLDDPVDVAASAVVNGVTLTGRSNKEDKQKYAGNDIRYGNAVQPVMRIVYGDDNSHKLNKVYVDYLRTPIYYSLSEDEIDAVEDNSQVIEFPDDVVYRIIDRVVNLILENNSNPRIQTHHAVNQSVV